MVFEKREESIGSRVKATKSEISTAAETVIPNWRKNWPTMPSMKATGTKTATMVSVVARTLRAISLRALERGLLRRVALLQELEDVLADDDGVVDEQADRQREAEERHHVQREAEHVHQEEGGDDAGREGEGADDRRPEIEHEDQDDQDGHRPAEDDGDLHLVGVLADELRLIDDQLGAGALREGLLHRRELLHHVVGDGHGVAAGLLDDLEGHGLFAVGADAGAHLGPAVLDRAEVAQAHRRAVLRRGDHELADGGDGAELADGADADLSRLLVEMAGGDGEVVDAEHLDDGLGREAERVEAGPLEVDLDLAIGAALDRDLRHALDLLERGAEHVVGELARLAERARAVERIGEDRRRGDVEPAHRGLLDLGGELEARLRHALAHLGRRLLDVGAELEEDHRRREALARVRLHAVDAVERDDGVFEGLRDLVLDLVRARARVDDADRHHREGDVGEELGAEAQRPTPRARAAPASPSR